MLASVARDPPSQFRRAGYSGASRARELLRVGARRAFSNGARVDVSAFRRHFRNYEDDDVFLNTGVSFPISFSRVRVEGIEAVIHLPFARRFALNGNFSNLSGKAQLPVTGGLFLDGGAQLLQSSQVFRISQDQRSSASWDFDVSPAKRLRSF